MNSAKIFAKIDSSSAYYQIELDDESLKIAIINTTQGLPSEEAPIKYDKSFSYLSREPKKPRNVWQEIVSFKMTFWFSKKLIDNRWS